ncbi:MAG TPA: DNA polymerase/3'-5' exonuclease PolX [bacterium]|nr:DNA polymerase/3'-5' exonuclease PolX [bacterium]
MNKNIEISSIFERIADILELKGENIFKVKAYRKAARIFLEMTDDILSVWKNGKISSIEGIGKSMAEKIDEYMSTGQIRKYSELLAAVPESLLDMLKIQNLGPRTLLIAHEKLGIKDINDLERVIANGQLAAIPGLGDKKVENIKLGIELYKTGKDRISVGLALPVVEDIMVSVSKVSVRSSLAGSIRRMRETIGDVDILAVSNDSASVIDAIVNYPLVKNITARGETKASVIIETYNLQVDLRVVSEGSYGAALQYFTGSAAHNVKLRGLAKDMDLKINEYGVFRGDENIAGRTEEEVYKILNLAWIPPELREDRGEIEAAMHGTLPMLVETGDIQGDIHTHSTYSDGINDIRTIALAAKERGYRYIGICDHSRTSRIAGGMDEEKLKARNEEIDEVQSGIKGIKILKGIEVDILSEGQLDYPDRVLEKLDFVIAAIHQGFSKNAGMRMKKAMENPYVDIIAHPTGRLLSGRRGYELDIEEIIEYAAEKNVALEINSHFDRLDLNDANILKGRAKGARFLISTDLHKIDMFESISLGVGMARRGWLEKKDVLNTYAWEDVPLRRRI